MQQGSSRWAGQACLAVQRQTGAQVLIGPQNLHLYRHAGSSGPREPDLAALPLTCTKAALPWAAQAEPSAPRSPCCALVGTTGTPGAASTLVANAGAASIAADSNIRALVM